MSDPTPQQILDCPLSDNDAQAGTVREYLTKLLALVWEDGETFNGKRPFGNSGWDGEIVIGLVRAGYVTGELDEDGYLDTADWDAAQRLVAEAIQHLGRSGA